MKLNTELNVFRKRLPMYIVISYAVYLAVTLAVTVWTARTLHSSGRIFLVDAFHGNEALADSVNHLLVVGFYLINVGYVALALETQANVDKSAAGDRTGQREDRHGAAGAGLHALLQSVGVQHHPPAQSAAGAKRMTANRKSSRQRAR